MTFRNTVAFFPQSLRLSQPLLSHHVSPSRRRKSHFPKCPPNPTKLPVPLSPPLPAISKHVELVRAMSASSLSFFVTRLRGPMARCGEQAPGNLRESVLESVRQLLCDSAESGTQTIQPELHLANRLDCDTSGLMIITKSHKVAAELVKAFTDHKVSKTYIARCIGSAPKWERITLKSGHGRSKFGVWRVYAASDVGRTLPGGSIVRDMETWFEILSVNGQGSNKEPSEFKKDEANVVVVEEKAVVDGNAKKDEVLVRARPRILEFP